MKKTLLLLALASLGFAAGCSKADENAAPEATEAGNSRLKVMDGSEQSAKSADAVTPPASQ